MATKKVAPKAKKKVTRKTSAKKRTGSSAKPAQKKTSKKKPAKKVAVAKKKTKKIAKKTAKKPAKKIAKKITKKPVKKVAKKDPAKKVAKTKKAPVKAVPKKKVAPKKTKSAAKAPLESFDLKNVVRRQKDVAWRMIDGEAVIITPSDSTMHTLNDVGTRIWELMTGQRSLLDMAQVLCKEFEVEQERAEKDTIWFVECLAKKGLVESK